MDKSVVNLSPRRMRLLMRLLPQYTGTIHFYYTIQPASITSATPGTVDIPDLTGPNTNLLGVVVNPPDVPQADTNVQNSGAGALRNGAGAKWDVSRQNKQKPINLANVPDSIHYDGQGGADLMVLYTNYPSDALAGNDDRGTGDEDNDPYTAGTAGSGNIGSWILPLDRSFIPTQMLEILLRCDCISESLHVFSSTPHGIQFPISAFGKFIESFEG